MTDYCNYKMSRRERLCSAVTGYLAAFGILYLFYRSFFVSAVFAAVGAFLYTKYRKRGLAEKSRWNLMVEFKDAMDSMVSALIAGYSVENAVTEAYRDLSLMYARDSPMLMELQNLRQKIRLQQPLDKLLLEMGRRSGVEDILTFAQIYATARKSGGNLVKVMKRTADNIGEKIEVQREIRTMIAGKRMESLCMTAVPLLIILYLQFFSPGFLDPVYHGIGGRLFMTAALAVYLLAAVWGQAIMDIERSGWR